MFATEGLGSQSSEKVASYADKEGSDHESTYPCTYDDSDRDPVTRWQEDSQ